MDQTSLRAQGPSLIGTALYGAVRRVVWDPWLALVSHGDPIRSGGLSTLALTGVALYSGRTGLVGGLFCNQQVS